MRELTPDMLARFAGSVTTRATCWRVTRQDGAVLGFTDHDRTLRFDGVTFEPRLGFDSSAATLEPDLAAGTAEVAGILSSRTIGEAELAGGLWDGAKVEIFAVDWQDPSVRLLLRRAIVGEVSRAGGVFRAELRALPHLFDQPQGRVFSHLCDADLGDGRCGVDLAQPAFRMTGTVSGGGAAELRVDGVAAADGWLAGGRLEVIGGASAGHVAEIVSDMPGAGTARDIALLVPLPLPLDPGTAVRLTAGCDKHFSTCGAKFANSAAFQGFPHMPGADFALTYPSRGAPENDGGALME